MTPEERTLMRMGWDKDTHRYVRSLEVAAKAVVDTRWCGRCGRRVEDGPHGPACPVGKLLALLEDE